MSTDLIAEHLVALSRWVDAGNAHRDPEAITLHRVIKVAEEMGEAVTALIGALGANPRKGIDGTLENVLEELLDVAVTALGAYEHIDAHQGRAYDELGAKIIRVSQRAGAVGPPDREARATALPVWTEYRSAVVYLDRNGQPDGVRETGPTRRSREEAVRDAVEDTPDDLRDVNEPPIARAIVSRTRYEVGDWTCQELLP